MRLLFLLGLLVAWELKASATSTALAPSLEALAQALRGDEQQARQRLAKEAEKLREDGDARAAELLQRLSEGAYESRDKPKVFSSSSTVESHTFVDHNGQRVEVRHQKNCRNGVCSEQTDTAHPKHKEEPSTSAMSLGAGMHHGQAHHVDVAARDMARELRAMEQQMDSNFNMDDIFQPALCAGSFLAAVPRCSSGGRITSRAAHGVHVGRDSREKRPGCPPHAPLPEWEVSHDVGGRRCRIQVRA